ncbi:hypothetical protein [Haloactinomyces albus]|uniref:Uncharacterized protein n=1 Tax=Haloactinomyces albus TaxID=1352928 RepID=A0AAE3ZIZ3_9ACTN|nr:hypothetical protein [Haloactinomyces albus]MDR7304478.1 hypothetical protein [Haloactinomyces albus]
MGDSRRCDWCGCVLEPEALAWTLAFETDAGGQDRVPGVEVVLIACSQEHLQALQADSARAEGVRL